MERTFAAGTPTLLRAMNERSVLELIHQRGPLSRAQLARESGLSKPTVSVALSGCRTEREIEEALASVLAGVTALVVVHRPSTLALADRVALLEGGRVAALGTHSELLRSSERYRSLLAEQAEVA